MCDGKSRIGEIVSRHTRVALLHGVAGVRIDGEEGDACAGRGVTIDEEAGIEGGPKLTVGEHDLLHT